MLFHRRHSRLLRRRLLLPLPLLLRRRPAPLQPTQSPAHERHFIEPQALDQAASRLLLLQIRQPPRLNMDILHLLLPRLIEPHHLLPRGRVLGLLEIRPQPCQQRPGALRQAVALVGGARVVGRVSARVEVLERGQEAGGDLVLLVEGEGFGEARVGDQVAVREDLGQDAGAGLFFLAEQGGAVLVSGRGVLGGWGGGGVACDGDFVAAELGVVE